MMPLFLFHKTQFTQFKVLNSSSRGGLNRKTWDDLCYHKAMTKKGFALTAAIVFSAGLTFHLLRIIFGWEVAIAEGNIPMWVSWIVVFIAGPLAYYGYKYSRE